MTDFGVGGVGYFGGTRGSLGGILGLHYEMQIYNNIQLDIQHIYDFLLTLPFAFVFLSSNPSGIVSNLTFFRCN